MRVAVVDAPGDYRVLVEPLPEGVELAMGEDVPGATGPIATLPDGRVSAREVDILHIFTNSQDGLLRGLDAGRRAIKQDGTIWVSWYKKAAKMPTELTEDIIREAALPLGLVDVKVCAVDEKWSGLKLVIRKENRR